MTSLPAVPFASRLTPVELAYQGYLNEIQLSIQHSTVLGLYFHNAMLHSRASRERKLSISVDLDNRVVDVDAQRKGFGGLICDRPDPKLADFGPVVD